MCSARPGVLDGALRVGNQIRDQKIDDLTERLVEFQFCTRLRVLRLNLFVELAEELVLDTERVEVKQIGFERVVEVSGVVGDFVDPVDELCFERGAEVEFILGEIGNFRFRIVVRMFDDAFADFKCEIQALEGKVAVLEMFNDAKGVEIVIESAAVFLHELVELALAGVTERRMADVMDEREGFREIDIQRERVRNGAGDLRNFEGVCESIAKVIGEARGENLGFGFEAAKRPRVHDAVAIARVFIAVGMRRFGKSPAATVFGPHGPRCESAMRFDRRGLRENLFGGGR